VIKNCPDMLEGNTALVDTGVCVMLSRIQFSLFQKCRVSFRSDTL